MALCISIVTPSLDQGHFLEETIRSVLSQEGDFFLDYQILDGGSKDNSLEIISKYEKLIENGLWPTRCRGIRYRWSSEPDNGQAAAINKGFSHAEGEVFGWLNSDDVYLPDALKRVATQDWSQIEFGYGRGVWISRRGVDLQEYPVYCPSRGGLFFQCTLCQPAVFFARRAYLELGPLSESFQSVFDYEYWLRAVCNRKRFKRIPFVLAKSRMHYQNKTLASQSLGSHEVDHLLAEYYGKRPIGSMRRFIYSRYVDIPSKKVVRQLHMALEITQ